MWNLIKKRRQTVPLLMEYVMSLRYPQHILNQCQKTVLYQHELPHSQTKRSPRILLCSAFEKTVKQMHR